jgi:hypothetical protein
LPTSTRKRKALGIDKARERVLMDMADADPVAASIDIGTQEMIARAQKLGIDTVFDRAAQMKPCNIGMQGICCKNCAMGPCRLPLPKGGIEGKDTRKGLCGATPTPSRPVTSSA